MLVVANWKMNPDSLFEAKKIFNELKKAKFDRRAVTPVICPAFVHLESLSHKYRGGAFKFGAQNIAPFSSNREMTGEISASMVKDLRVEYVIIGHSERRKLGEDNNLLAKKIANALKNKITPIVCLGEEARDQDAGHLRELEKQIREILGEFSKEAVRKIVLVYEPVWAVGEKGSVIEVHDLNQTVLFIRKILVGMFDRKMGMSLPILYGGSVNEENIDEILKGDIHGFLIGRASVNPFTLKKILKRVTAV